MEFHEASMIFPMLPDEEMQELAEDIRRHGLRNAIWLYDGKILDGRNRYRACELVGVEPTFEDKTGQGSPIELVLSENVYRRHLTIGQRAMVGLAVEAQFRAEAHDRLSKQAKERERGEAGLFLKGDTSSPPLKQTGKHHPAESGAKAGAAVGVSRNAIWKAKTLTRDAPDLAEEVRQGSKDLHTAHIELRTRQAEAERDAVEKLNRQRLQTELLEVTQAVEAKNFTEAANLIAKISFAKDWKKLGYDMWEVFATMELYASGLLTEEKEQFSIELAKKGMSYRAIGPVVGLDESTIRKYDSVRDAKGESTTNDLPSAACRIESPAELIGAIDADLKRLLGPFYTLNNPDRHRLKNILTNALKSDALKEIENGTTA